MIRRLSAIVYTMPMACSIRAFMEPEPIPSRQAISKGFFTLSIPGKTVLLF
jgi:hypothetical protein